MKYQPITHLTLFIILLTLRIHRLGEALLRVTQESSRNDIATAENQLPTRNKELVLQDYIQLQFFFGIFAIICNSARYKPAKTGDKLRVGR